MFLYSRKLSLENSFRLHPSRSVYIRVHTYIYTIYMYVYYFHDVFTTPDDGLR